ncbi:MAG: hypothetical protein HY684_04005 [Chloroflexi bacterium]|nr:hypothetical protein [Chloroflexota bacterium]
MRAPGGHQERLLRIGVIIVFAALLGLSVACGARTSVTTPPPAALTTSVAAQTTTPVPLKQLEVNPQEGPIGTAFTVTGDGLPPGKAVDLVWVATDDSDMTHVKERFSIGRSVTNARGGFAASLIALQDHGEFFDIYAMVDGESLAKGVFRVPGAI